MWTLEKSKAFLTADNLQCSVDLSSPQAGIREVTAHQHRCSEATFSLLKMGLESEVLTESYQRGKDLITSYASNDQRPASPQIYRRSQEYSQAIGLETIVSLQTDLLASRCPIHSVTEISHYQSSMIRNSENHWQTAEPLETPQALLVEFVDELYYLEIAHPTDVTSSSYSQTQGKIQWQHTLLDLQLEKGVIRRARLQSWWIKAAEEGARSVADTLIENFINSPPPLTT